jgi:hypothetical protein
LECTGSRFHVYLRLGGAIAVESSDESLRYERVTSQIVANPAKALTQRLGNSSLFSRYIDVAMLFTVFTCVFDGLATVS